jgi:hypothetical protein
MSTDSVQVLTTTTTILNFQKGACIDSSSMAGITNDTSHIHTYNSSKYTLTGIRGQAGQARGCTDSLVPTVTDDSKPLLLCTANSFLAKDTHENLLSLGQLLLDGYCVSSTAGCKDYPQFGGHITPPDGQRITMTFAENLWLLPLWAPATKTRGTGKVQQPQPVPNTNPFAALLTKEDPEEVITDVHVRHL